MSTLLWTLLLPMVALAEPVLLAHDGALVTVELAEPSVEPGDVIGLYASEARVDPRTGEQVEGLRFAGDGRVLWVGPDLVQIALDHPDQPLGLGGHVVLGDPRGTAPTAAFSPPEPEPEPPRVTVVPLVEPMPVPAAPEPEVPRRKRREVATLHDAWHGHYGGRTQGVVATLDWADDGYGTGVGALALGWRWVPDRGPGRVDVTLEGLRGARWVAAEDGSRSEPWAREPAVGYWLWSSIEGSATALAPELGLAVGVQQSGPTGGFSLGLRTGLPHAGHVRLRYARYGALGNRWTLQGAVPLSDRLRIGPRARVGALPVHEQPDVVILVVGADEPWKQQRADGTLRATWDASDALTLTLGAGLAGYDLLFADAGPVLDTALELRW